MGFGELRAIRTLTDSDLHRHGSPAAKTPAEAAPPVDGGGEGETPPERLIRRLMGW